MASSSVRALIDDFLRQKRIAVVGVSRDARHFSRMIFGALREREYDAVPVNPATVMIDGIPCFRHVADITPKVDAVMILTAGSVTDEVVLECAGLGIRRLWIAGTGPKVVSEAVLTVCREYGIGVIPGYCPFMFLPGASAFHRLHGWVLRLLGRYPI